jgi:hypothetical protein
MRVFSWASPGACAYQQPEASSRTVILTNKAHSLSKLPPLHRTPCLAKDKSRCISNLKRTSPGFKSPTLSNAGYGDNLISRDWYSRMHMCDKYENRRCTTEAGGEIDFIYYHRMEQALHRSSDLKGMERQGPERHWCCDQTMLVSS